MTSVTSTGMAARRWGAAWATMFMLTALLCIPRLVDRANREYGDHFAYLQASRVLLAGDDPYLPRNHWVYLYPPFWAFLITPLALLPAGLFAAAWGGILGLCWLSTRPLIRQVLVDPGEAAVGHAWEFLPYLLAFRFLLGSWGSGQVTLLLFVLILAALDLHRKGHDVRAAGLLAIASAIKVFPAFLAILFLKSGHRRGLGAFVLFITLLSLSPVLETGPERFGVLLRTGFLERSLDTFEVQKIWPGRCSPVIALARPLGLTPGPTMTLLEIGFFIVVTSITIVLRREAGSDHAREGLWLSMAVTSMLMVTPMVAENWLSMLTFPLAAALRQRGRVALTGVVLSGFLLNIYSPLIVGRHLSDRLQSAGLGAAGLVTLWLTLVLVLAIKDRKGPANGGSRR